MEKPVEEKIEKGGAGALEGRVENISKDVMSERIQHDSSSEKTELFGRAMVQSGQDKVRGEYIVYDARTETYLVDGRKVGEKGASGGRVRAVSNRRQHLHSAAIPR